MNLFHRGLWVVLVCWLAPTSRAQLPFTDGLTFGAKPPVVRVTNYWSATGLKPGGQIVLGLVLDIAKPYHINSDHPKENYIATKVDLVNAPPEVRSSTPIFPEAHEVELGTGTAKEKISVFSDRTILYVPFSVTAAAQPGEKEIELKIQYQACDDKSCLPPQDLAVKTKLLVVAPGMEVNPANESIFAGMKDLTQRLNIAFFGWDFKIEPAKLWLLLIIAAVGGVLLNFTPCVLPLIPIKIIGLSQAAGNRQRCFLLGLALSCGVVTFWLALATAISSISGFNATNKLFQYPAFTIGVGVIICAMAVGMCGLFAVSLPQWVYRVNPSQESFGGSFLFGIMTAVLSTPCTAPFMGARSLVGYAKTGDHSGYLCGHRRRHGLALPWLIRFSFPGAPSASDRTGQRIDQASHGTADAGGRGLLFRNWGRRHDRHSAGPADGCLLVAGWLLHRCRGRLAFVEDLADRQACRATFVVCFARGALNRGRTDGGLSLHPRKPD